MQTERERGAERGFGLESDGGERLSWMGEPTMLKVIGQDTGGLYTVAEIITTPEGLVPCTCTIGRMRRSSCSTGR